MKVVKIISERFLVILLNFIHIVSFVLCSYKLCLYARKTKLIILTRITRNRNFVGMFPALYMKWVLFPVEQLDVSVGLLWPRS